MARYHVIACHVLWRELCHFASLSPHVFTFNFVKQGLHNTPELLKVQLQKAVDEAPEECEAVLMGYGLCSNGAAGVVARTKPLVIPRAHDCITFFLGSKERYREYFDAHPGTYWYTPGWIECSLQPGLERYNFLRRDYVEKYGEDNADYLMEMEQGWMKEYSNAAYIDLGFSDTVRFKEYTRECAQWLGWKTDELQGDSGMIQAFVGGQWDSDRFLIVEPGQTIVASHDEAVVKAG
ncbi:MAG: DUF1638 domain-containing protein [bacterium]|jgi:hypothetical protein